VLALSPGFVVADGRTGTPPLFVAHGTRDDVLPIDRCGRRIVRDARHRGYAVTFVEFDGGHTVPPEIARRAMDWFMAPS
jgi:phospholipase/carboxylesterase